MVLLVISLCLNVYLGWKVKQGNVQAITPKLSPGMKVDPVTALGHDGERFTISYNSSDKPTVFYVITPSCIWCKRNQANINKVADTKANDFRFIGLSLAEPGLKEYVEEHHLKFPTYTGLTRETMRSLGLGNTPQTIVVSPEGKILKVWMGAYDEEVRSEVEAYFGVQLPGLTSLSN
jgi:peroxiredoxin